jgi:hypothetical protein
MVTAPAPSTTSPPTPGVRSDDTAPAAVCAVCPHPLAAHDAISRRFCQATQAHAMTRGCVCPTT